jgi:hypothetical protein
VVFHNHVSDHGLHVIAAIMIGASILVLLLTVADRGLRKPIGSQAPTNHPPATHVTGRKRCVTSVRPPRHGRQRLGDGHKRT